MSHTLDLEKLCLECLDIARDAGEAILTIYDAGFNVEEKEDKSPLTDADMASHHLIVDRLAALTPDIPILSEESAKLPFEERASWETYWLVDPLDGTREFVKRNGEFTVNIALIHSRVHDINRPGQGKGDHGHHHTEDQHGKHDFEQGKSGVPSLIMPIILHLFILGRLNFTHQQGTYCKDLIPFTHFQLNKPQHSLTADNPGFIFHKIIYFQLPEIVSKIILKITCLSFSV